MKHNLKITLILLVMFVVTQFLGIYVANFYSPVKIVDGEMQNISAPEIPYGLQQPQIQEKDFYYFFPSLIFSFVFAILIIFLISKFKFGALIKIWFFVVIVIALGISLNSFFPNTKFFSWAIIFVSIILAYFKIFKKEMFVHNLTEILIYPGIAVVFIPLLNIWTLIFLLVLISVYDIWAVWHSGIMQKMAKYQINELNIFAGFFIPYTNKKTKEKINLLKEKYEKEELESKAKEQNLKINLAILGGGDVVFPIIASGVILKELGFISTTIGLIPIYSLMVLIGATLGLGYLFFFAEKKKFYPAMPYITAGIFLGLLVNLILKNYFFNT